MPYAIRIHEHGGPEVLRWEEIPTPTPGPGEVLLRQEAVGCNFIDTYHRSGLYPLKSFPAIIGMEGAGVIEALGEGVSDYQVGDLVAYGIGPIGAYAEIRTIPASALLRVPPALTAPHVAGMLLRGLTAFYLLHVTYRVSNLHTILVHAAAGGMGAILCQWAKWLGATVIGTVGSEEKRALAIQYGCDHVFNSREEDWVRGVREVTKGKGVHVVYDGVGKDTFLSSLDCLTTLGMMVSYGQASGPVPPIDVGLLRDKGSLFLTRPTVMDYAAGDATSYLLAANEFFSLILRRVISMPIGQSYYLRDAATAHRDLEARRTHGSTVLVVG
jgi:NADPH2:quinone reductase